MNKMLLHLTKATTKNLFLFLFLNAVFFSNSSCKKDSVAPAFTYLGKWTIAYNFTTGSMATGTFTATLKSNGKWDYAEAGFSQQADAGTWTSSGNNINFSFNGFGLASYTGTKVNDNKLSGTAVGDAGVSTGTWTATR